MELSLLWDDPSLVSENFVNDLNQEDEILKFLGDIKNSKAPQFKRIEIVKNFLHKTVSDMVRNQAALALIDLMSREAAPEIVRALRDKDISGSSGTLLFALNEIEAELPLDIIARTVVAGSYEAQNEAMFALEQNRVASAGEDIEKRVIDDITPFLASDDEATAEVAGNLLAHIEGRRSAYSPV